MSILHVTWNNFLDHAGTSFRDLVDEPSFLDVTLACDDDRLIPAHKLILSASSEFFKNIFLRNYHQSQLIFLDGVSHTELISIVTKG